MLLSRTTGISAFALVFLITGAVDNIRNLPATALFGSSLIFFLFLSALFFLIPTALISAELASAHPEKGGIYHWASVAFGKKWGFLTIWLQWINTMVWFPTILSFIVSTAAYLINPALAQNQAYLIAAMLLIFWGLTFIHLRGIHTSTIFANICAIIGIFIPMAIIIALGVFWLLSGKPLQITFNQESLFPSLSASTNWVSLTAIMASFLGIELSTVHINDVHNPQKNFPRAMLISVALILFTMTMGSLAIAFILPQKNIHLVDGIMQAFDAFFAAYHLSWIMPFIALMLFIGTLGNLTSWMISPAKGLLQAAQNGFLPLFLTKQNKHGVAKNLLLAQAVLVSLICLAFSLMPSVNGAYWLLTALSTELYILMYVLMFFAALKLKHSSAGKRVSGGFTIPFGTLGHFLVCLLGLAGCITTLIVGFIPPEGIDVGNSLHYKAIFLFGMIAMILPVGIFYKIAANNKKAHERLQ